MNDPAPYRGGAEHYVEAAGMSWNIASAGPEDGDHVLLLHGFPEHWRSWSAQIPALASAGFRVHAADMPGYGGTDEPASYDLNTLASSVAGLSGGLSRDGVHLVGHDWGGIVGHCVAAQHPQTVRSFTAVAAPHPATFRKVRIDPKRLMNSAYVLLFQVPGIEHVIGNRKFIERFARGAVSDIGSAAEMRRALEYYRTNLRPWNPGDTEIGNVTQPGLVIHALRDVAIGSELMEQSAELFDDLRDYVELDCPHFLLRRCGERVNEHLVGFLRSL